jgi:uncharacterized protein YgiM (DUF1202 family)
MKKKIIIIILIYLLGVITIPIINKIKEKKLDSDVMYKVTINQKYINVRPEIDLGSEILTEVLEGETYEVVDYYEGNKYNWYKIRYGKRVTGWIASDKTDSWVTINEED